MRNSCRRITLGAADKERALLRMERLRTSFRRKIMNARVADGQQGWRVRMLLLHGAMLVAPGILLLLSLTLQLDPPSSCAFRAVTGIDCPGCGVTRSSIALLSGRVADSFAIHPAGPFVYGVVALLTIYLIVTLVAKCTHIDWRREANIYAKVDGVVIGSLLTVWVWRVLQS